MLEGTGALIRGPALRTGNEFRFGLLALDRGSGDRQGRDPEPAAPA